MIKSINQIIRNNNKLVKQKKRFIKMINIATKFIRLTHNNKFTFIPPSCYEIQSKVNPVINVTLGTDKADFCNIQFRVIYFIL